MTTPTAITAHSSQSSVGMLAAIGFCHCLVSLPVAGAETPLVLDPVPAPEAAAADSTGGAAATAGKTPAPRPPAPPKPPKLPEDPGSRLTPQGAPDGRLLPDPGPAQGDSPAAPYDPALPPLLPGDVPDVPPLPDDGAGLPADPFAVAPQPAAADTAAGDFFENLNTAIGGSSALGVRPSGFADLPMGFGGDPGGFANSPLGRLNPSVSLSGTYDSNPSRGYARPGQSGGSDFYLTLGGSLSYLTEGPIWTFGGSYSGGYNFYFNQTNLSGYNQQAGASVNYHHGPLSATLTGGISFGSGANRYYAAVVDQWTYSLGLSARYILSPKTVLSGHFSPNLTNTSGAYSNTSSYSAGLSLLWRYSPLTEFGPGISYTSSTGGPLQDRTTLGPTLTLNHTLTSKLSLNSQIGLDFVEYDPGGSGDPTWSGSIGLNYRPSELWGMNLGFYRGTQADASTIASFNESTSLRLGYYRNISRARFSLGVSYETNTSQSGFTVATLRPDRDNFSIDTSIGMPIATKTYASIFMRYEDESGGSLNSWDSFQMGFSVNRSF